MSVLLQSYNSTEAAVAASALRFALHNAGNLSAAHTIDPANQPANFQGDALGTLFIAGLSGIGQVEFDLQVNVSPRHVPMIR